MELYRSSLSQPQLVKSRVSSVSSLLYSSDSGGRAYPVRYEDPEEMDRDCLYMQFRPLVRRLVAQYGTTQLLREDLIGEIYCRFCALLDAYDPERGVPLRPYIVRQLTSSVYTFVRSHRRSPSRELPFDECLDDNHRDLRFDPTDEWNQSMAIDSIRDVIPTALSELSERQKNVVIWRYYHDCSFEEIALRLNVQTATARSLLRHALNSMR
jgi:RNA polymerase sigma factor (sigma-70 family)